MAQVTVQEIGQTAKAIRVQDRLGATAWLPRSQVTVTGEVGSIVGPLAVLELPGWLARRSGLEIDG